MAMQESDPSSLLPNSLSGIVIKAVKSKKANEILPDNNDDDPSSPLNNSMSGIVIKEDPGISASHVPGEDMYEEDVNQDMYENELPFGEGDHDEGTADGAARGESVEELVNTSDNTSAGKNVRNLVTMDFTVSFYIKCGFFMY